MARAQSRSSGRKRSRSNVISVDFTDVESAGTIADGWAKGAIKSAEPGESKEGNPKVTVVWKVVRGKEKANVYDEVSLQPQALWRFKSLLEACGYKVEDSAMDIDPEDIVDLECDVQIVNDDSYDGRDRPKVAAYAALDSHTKAAAGKKGRDDEEEDDRPARRARDEEEEDDDPPPRRRAKDEEEEEDDRPARRSRKDRDEEEEEEPPRRRKAKDDDAEEEDEPPRKGKKPKFRSGDRVVFEHRKKSMKGAIVALETDVVVVETADGSEYEVGYDEVELA